MAEAPRTHFKDYRQLAERFGGGFGREGLEDLDLGAIAALSGAARDEAVAVLRAHLNEGNNDPRALRALVALRPADLGEALRLEIRRSVDETGVAAALALWETEGDETGIEALVRLLRTSYFETARQAAAAALATLPKEAPVDEALLAALEDESAAVRNIATSVLLGRAGLAALETQGRSKVSRLGGLLLSPLSSVRGPAATELKEILAALRAGATAEGLGLLPAPGPESPALGRLRESVLADPKAPGPWRREVDVASFRDLRGEERLRGAQLLLLLLGKGDLRGVRAAGALGAAWALPALRELAEGRQDKVGEGARRAIEQIEAAQRAEEDLLAALDAEEPEARARAGRGLVGGLGLAADVARSRIATLLAMLRNPLRSVARRAAQDLRAVRAGLHAGGAPPPDLDAAPSPSTALDRLTEAALGGADEADVALLKGLKAEERLWAEHLIFHLLGQGDPRGLRAVVALSARWAAPALQELAAGEGEGAAAARKALAWLGASG